MSTYQPQRTFNEESEQDKGENARLQSFVGAIAISDLVKTTLGPKGMDKILQSMSNTNSMEVTNDGATILKSIYVDNPAAKVLVDISKVQDDEVGDGTTSVCVLAGELLREAEKLVDMKIHPQTIITGWRLALEAARKALDESAKDNGDVEEDYKNDLVNIAKTTLSSKILTTNKQYFAELAVDAILRIKGTDNADLENIQIIKIRGGTLADSYLEDGFLLNKRLGVNQPKRIENAKILIANTPMDTDKIKIFGLRVRVDSTAKLADIEKAEKKKMRTKCEKIIEHNCNVFVNRQLIYNFPEQILAEGGLSTIEHADFEGVERLARVTGGEIVSTFDSPDTVQLGECDLIEEVIVGEDTLIRFSGCAKKEACTVVLRGGTGHILEEADRSLHDALCVLQQMVKETRVVLGGGCSETIMALAVEEAASKTAGKKSIAMKAFASALMRIPTIIADNAGYDSSELVTELKAAHHEGKNTAGLDMNQGTVGDVAELGITESYRVKKQVLVSAAEAAEMVLRVDSILRAAPRKRDQEQMGPYGMM